MNQSIRIIGIDPGLRQTGWGIIDASGNSLTFVASGTIKTNAKAELANRLVTLYAGIEDVLRQQDPAEAAIESTFVNRDGSATLKLGQARGVALLAPARAGLVVSEYAPNAVKKSVVGTGHGDKRQIQMMVKTLLPKAIFETEHAADALAIAICHAHMRSAATLANRVSSAL